MLTLRLAWRSFIRHRWRSAIASSAVALGLAMLLLFVGFADDAHSRMAELGIRMGSGNVLIEARGYRESQTLDYTVRDADRIAANVEALPGVHHVAVRLRTTGLLSAGEHSAPALISGVEPHRELDASDLPSARARVAGQYLRAPSEMPFASMPADIYLGKTLAENLAVGVGDRVVLTSTPPGGGEPTAAALEVRGVFRTGVDEFDGAYAEIPIETVRALVGLPDAATEIAVLSDLDQTDALAEAVRKSLSADSTLAVVPWQTALRELHEAIVLDDAGLYLMMLIVFVVVAIGIFNTVMMSISERTREFGVMMALGTSGARLCFLILAEACILAAVSVVIGLALGLSLSSWIAIHGVDLTRWTGEIEFAGIAWSGRVYSALTPSIVMRWTLVVAAVVIVSALYPAVRVMRLEPVEAIRHV